MSEHPGGTGDDVDQRRQQAGLDQGRDADSAGEKSPAEGWYGGWLTGERRSGGHWSDLTFDGLQASLRPLLDREHRVGALLTWALLPGVPYLIAGLVWALTHTQRFASLSGLDLVVSALGSIVFWPVLLLFTLCT